MAVPWLQIVQLVPSIVDVSRELLKKNKRPPVDPGAPQSTADLEARIGALEDNERRQAELVTQMAEQLSAMAKVIVELRSRIVWLTAGIAIAIVVAVVALFV
jgi:uncharacterized coiled-coil protein SlyX